MQPQGLNKRMKKCFARARRWPEKYVYTSVSILAPETSLAPAVAVLFFFIQRGACRGDVSVWAVRQASHLSMAQHPQPIKKDLNYIIQDYSPTGAFAAGTLNSAKRACFLYCLALFRSYLYTTKPSCIAICKHVSRHAILCA